MVPSAEAGASFAATMAELLPRGALADREQEQLRARNGLVVLPKNLLLSSGGRELSQRDDNQGHKHRRTQEGGDDDGSDSSGPQRACRDREQGGERSAGGGAQAGRALGVTPTASMSPAVRPSSWPGAAHSGHGRPVPTAPHNPGVVLHPSSIEPLGRGWGQPLPPQPAPGDKDSRHKAGLWHSALPELLGLLQSCLATGVRCSPGARKGVHTPWFKGFRQALALKSPACAQGTFRRCLL